MIPNSARARRLLPAVLALPLLAEQGRPAEITLGADSPMAPPTWALLERELFRAGEAACEEFYRRYFDDRGYLECVVRWGGDDGPDDAIENVRDWPLLHALGASDAVLRTYRKVWEGHLRQYTEARTTEVPFAREGMYFREFPVMFDWLHHGEGLCAFNFEGLSDPGDPRLRERVKRFAGFYTGEDPQAPNYDREHRIIRSLFNGSRGPLLRKATALDWAGDPLEVEGRFRLGHGERSYQEMLEHFKDYTGVVGDHPQNLCATTLALNAYLLGHGEGYRKWILEYVDAWVQRTEENGGIIPTNVGLDGKIGGACNGKWYGGVYGWGFSVRVPGTGEIAHRNHHELALIGFGNAILLTGDQRYAGVWRRMIEKVDAQKKVIEGKATYPTMYGDEGWYAYSPQKYSHGALEVWYWSMDRGDLQRLPPGGWISFLEGKNPGYPEDLLRSDFAALHRKVVGMRQDPTTPDTRLADDPLKFNPADAGTLVRLMLGGLPPGNTAAALHSRLRYFDPARRRAGVPEDVGALVEEMTADSVTVTIVNLHQTAERRVVVQGGAYAEHRFTEAEVEGRKTALEGAHFTLRLGPGAGARLRLLMKRYANQPTLAFPWN
jgi:hypothetical protein